jgi:hypothetical protein
LKEQAKKNNREGEERRKKREVKSRGEIEMGRRRRQEEGVVNLPEQRTSGHHLRIQQFGDLRDFPT